MTAPGLYCAQMRTALQCLTDVLCINTRHRRGQTMTEDWRGCGWRTCRTWASWAAAAAASRGKSGTALPAACCASRCPPAQIFGPRRVAPSFAAAALGCSTGTRATSLQDATQDQLPTLSSACPSSNILAGGAAAPLPVSSAAGTEECHDILVTTLDINMRAQVIPFDVQSDQLRKQISAELHTLHGSRHPHIVAYYASFLQVRLLREHVTGQCSIENSSVVGACCAKTCLLDALSLSSMLLQCGLNNMDIPEPRTNESGVKCHITQAQGAVSVIPPDPAQDPPGTCCAAELRT